MAFRRHGVTPALCARQSALSQAAQEHKTAGVKGLPRNMTEKKGGLEAFPKNMRGDDICLVVDRDMAPPPGVITPDPRNLEEP